MVKIDRFDEPRVFSSDDEELKYINDFFGDIEPEESKKNILANENKSKKERYKPITLTKKELMVLTQSMRYNDDFVMPFVSDKLTTASLLEKGFIEENREKERANVSYKVKKNVKLLFEIEGYKAFDEIVV